MNDVAALSAREKEMTRSYAANKIQGNEHWAKKGDVNLFLWEKQAVPGTAKRGSILFVHGSSMPSQPVFDLGVEGVPDSSAMEYFAERGFNTWCMDMEGYGRSDKHHGVDATIADGVEDPLPGPRISNSIATAGLCWSTAYLLAPCVHPLSRNAIRSVFRGWRSMLMSGRGRGVRRSSSAGRNCPNISRPSGGP